MVLGLGFYKFPIYPLYLLAQCYVKFIRIYTYFIPGYYLMRSIAGNGILLVNN
jgi:hypothetical protein